MGSTADHQHDYEERRVPPKAWEKAPAPSNLAKEVVTDILMRDRKGQQEYKTTMDRTDLDELQWMEHHYEELLDAALYVKKQIEIKRKQIAIEYGVYQ